MKITQISQSLITFLTGGFMVCLFLTSQLRAAEPAWATFSGEVVDVQPNSFTVDYVDGNVVVKISNWDWFGKKRNELRGKKVRVCGHVLRTEDEPSVKPLGIYIAEYHTYHHSKAAEAPALVASAAEWVVANLLISGKVVAENGREFTLDTGDRKVIIDTGDMVDDPLDDNGYQRINPSDHVLVTAMVNDEFFEQGRVDARRVTSLVANLAD